MKVPDPDNPSARIGRPRIHADAAARQRAWRERLAAAGRQEKRSEDKTAPERAARRRRRKKEEIENWRQTAARLAAPDDATVAEVIERHLSAAASRHDAGLTVAATLRRLTATPYLLTGPTLISVSGGRTSAYLLHRILQAHGGRLPDDAKAVFANTGREREETLRFVADISARWNVEITWVEYDPSARHKTRIVDFAGAGRRGEPFAALIDSKQYLPGPRMRFCTAGLKIERLDALCRHFWGWPRWTSVIGLRADEPRRVERITAKISPWKTNVCPLAVDGVTQAYIEQWWARQPFDLDLPPGGGLSNCDLCFLKRKGELFANIRRDPGFVDWWVAQEERMTNRRDSKRIARFRSDLSYRQLADIVLSDHQNPFPADQDHDEIDCHCHD